MNSYLYRFSYFSPTTGTTAFYYHFLITAKTDEECYALAIKEIKEEHLSELDKAKKEILSTKIESEFDIENLLRNEKIFPASISYLFHTIQHSRRYFLEESALLDCDVDEIKLF